MASTQGIQLSKVSPSFLQANSTSHTWTFSAMAELIDNAYDPDVNASQLWIDKTIFNNKICLTFVDNGNGMDPEKLLRMLSFGFCEKVAVSGHKPIGQYGNGFKSGSMRLGRDALVFTRNLNSMSVGMLSQSYLEAVREETVLVPIVTWKLPQKTRSANQGSLNNLRAILKYSIFRKESSLLEELGTLEMLKTGTKIIIYNLKRGNDGKLELDFESDSADIRNPESHEFDYSSINRPLSQYSPEYRRSLREYCSILYLKPRMKIILRGKKVQTKLISKSLSRTETDIYRPTWLPKPILLTFGFSPNKNEFDSENYGVLMYHRNRLIKAYEKVGYQRQANELGVGVVGVVEVDFLDPIHNKQDFKRTDRYNTFMTSLGTKLNDYWNEKCGGSSSVKIQSVSSATGVITIGGSGALGVAPEPDWLWVQCDNCLKWRRLPTGIGFRDLPEKWYCHMNPDASHNRCDVEEEPEDEDEALRRPSYEKTFKKAQEIQRKRKQIEEFQKQQEKDSQLVAMKKELERRDRDMRQGIVEVTSSTEKKPSTTELTQAQKALESLIQKQKTQAKIIQKLKSQKDHIKTKQVEILKAAEVLHMVQRRNDNYLDTNWSNVSSTSQPNRMIPAAGVTPPSKRSLDAAPETVTLVKRHRIKTEDGNYVTVTLNEDTAPVPDLATRRREEKEKSNQEPVGVIDLTDEDDPKMDGTNGILPASNSNMMPTSDVSVAVEVSETPIDMEVTAMEVTRNRSSVGANEVVSVLPSANRAGNEDDGIKIISVNSVASLPAQAAATDSVVSAALPQNNASPAAAPPASAASATASSPPSSSASASRLASEAAASEDGEEENLDCVKKRLNELRENVKRLIEIIVPNIDFGEHKIDDVVVEMIRINSQVNS
ncbi:family CW-type zinc finger 3-like [Octopus vulgaris]|uniref:Family CW-type zinc finger 3-like n=2 Tax=Octopus TaxID=6643 RepID=A0AA36FK62_OCTVU|nr:MORC family CW-type zinc finger protein 3 isoform X2 [Octopus sinensis]CAI9739999.1 family CW-type zinc finger 3-like [Octopus vulgaris]